MMKQQRSNVRFTQILVALALIVTLLLVLGLAFFPQAITFNGTPPPVPGESAGCPPGTPVVPSADPAETPIQASPR